MKWGVLIFLAAAWLSWSGHYTLDEWLVALFGVASCLFVWRLHVALDRAAGARRDFFRASAWLRLPRFLVSFVLRVASSSLHVTRLILSPQLAVEPRLRRVRASQTTPFGKVLYANFITLTPGTITLDLRSDELLVYALDEASEGDVTSGAMDRDVSRLEGDATQAGSAP